MVRRAALASLIGVLVASGAVTVGPLARAATPLPPMAGRLDPSFGGGYVVADPSPEWDWGQAVAVQSDGRVVVAGSFRGDGPLPSWDVGVMRFTAAGAVDTTFGEGGKVVVDPAGAWDEARAVLVQPDGKLIVTGILSPTNTESYGNGFVMRLLPDGRPDPSFQGGTVTLPLGTTVNDAARTPAGEIVVSGWHYGKALAARLRGDGTLDPSFGQGGLATFESPGFGGDALVLQPDGGMVVAGSQGTPGAPALAVRFTAVGALDTAFGAGGVVRTSLSTETRSRRAEIKDGTLDAQGRIVLTGSAWLDEDYSPFPAPGMEVMNEPSARPKRFVNRDVALIRYLPDGSLDPALGGAGKLVTPIPLTVPDARPPGLPANMNGTIHRESDGAAIAVDPQGRLLVAGAVGQPGFVAAVMRFTSAGILDPTFGVAGVSAVAQPFDLEKPSAAFFSDLALLPDGRMVTAGRMYDATKHAVVVARFLPGTATTSVWSWGWNGVGQLGDGTGVDRRAPVQTQGLSGAVSVSAGAHHTLALTGDGSVWAWGWNVAGQLGDGTTVDRTRPVRVTGLNGVVAVAAGYYHSLALRGDGTVWAWGWNPVGQLGDGTTVDRTRPVRVTGLAGAVAISAGAFHSLAARDDGTVWGWGWNGFGGLADGTTETRLVPTPARVNMWTSAISAGAFDSLAASSQGFGMVWGWNAAAPPSGDPPAVRTVPSGIAPPVLRVAGGGYHSLALRDTGEIVGMGNNSLGQLGDGTATDAPYPRAVPGIRATEVAAGTVHSLALLADGTVRAWGWNVLGQLGNGTTADSRRPVVVSGLTNATSISAGYLHSVAIRVG